MDINFLAPADRSDSELKFEELIDTYVNSRIGVSEHFLPLQLAHNLKQNLLDLHAAKAMHAAGIGKDKLVVTNLSVRGDDIYWLDRSHNDAYENQFLDLIDAFVLYLNSTCYTGITGYEFHYTLYKKGAFYKRHIDQFHNDQSRQFSMIAYLNEEWKPTDGGELQIALDGEDVTIVPTNRKAVFFKSNELEHEVLTTHANRLSITGWLKKG